MNQIMRIALLSMVMCPSMAYARGGGADGMSYFICFVMLVVFGIFVFAVTGVRKHQEEMVKQGKAVFYVKVAATGRVYHSLNCGKCRTGHKLTENEARGKGYSPCATCGGRGTYHPL